MEDIDLKKEIGNKIRQKRGDIKQKNFAKLIGVHKDQLSRYETGKSFPRPKLYKKIMEWREPYKSEVVKEQQLIYYVSTDEQKKLHEGLDEILQSGYDAPIEALKANIRAFLEMVRVSKKTDENKGGD